MRAKINAMSLTRNFEPKGTKSITPRQTTMLDSFKMDQIALENKRHSEIDMTKNQFKRTPGYKDPDIQPIKISSSSKNLHKRTLTKDVPKLMPI